MMGDFNARTASKKMQEVSLTTPSECQIDEVIEPTWERHSEDQVTNAQGIALLSLMTAM